MLSKYAMMIALIHFKFSILLWQVKMKFIEWLWVRNGHECYWNSLLFIWEWEMDTNTIENLCCFIECSHFCHFLSTGKKHLKIAIAKTFSYLFQNSRNPRSKKKIERNVKKQNFKTLYSCYICSFSKRCFFIKGLDSVWKMFLPSLFFILNFFSSYIFRHPSFSMTLKFNFSLFSSCSIS
jgi:hypothetical protein